MMKVGKLFTKKQIILSREYYIVPDGALGRFCINEFTPSPMVDTEAGSIGTSPYSDTMKTKSLSSSPGIIVRAEIERVMNKAMRRENHINPFFESSSLVAIGVTSSSGGKSTYLSHY